MAPHGTGDGLLGLAALVQVCATLPHNYIAFEYPTASDRGGTTSSRACLAGRVVTDSMVDLLPGPGLGLDIDAKVAKRYLADEDGGFFDLW